MLLFSEAPPAHRSPLRRRRSADERGQGDEMDLKGTGDTAN